VIKLKRPDTQEKDITMLRLIQNLNDVKIIIIIFYGYQIKNS